MSFIRAVIGGTLGFAVGGPVGAVIGAGAFGASGATGNSGRGQQMTDAILRAQGLAPEQVAARQPNVDRFSQFYESVYGAGLTERGRAEADFYMRMGRLQDPNNTQNFDTALDFDRAFAFLVQQREDQISENVNTAPRMGRFGETFAPTMFNRINASSLTYSGESVIGI